MSFTNVCDTLDQAMIVHNLDYAHKSCKIQSTVITENNFL